MTRLLRRRTRHRVLLGSFAAWSASLAECTSTPPPPYVEGRASTPAEASAKPPAPPARPTGTAAVDPGMDLNAELVARVVSEAPLAFGHLYTWTNEDQLAELVAGKPLLSRAVSGKHGVSAFDDLVASDVVLGDEVAKLLWHEGYANKRFGWPVLYAALRGSPEPVYGNVLIDVVLKKEAYAIDYRNGQVHALDGSHPTLADVVAHPERLAVVFHTTPTFREMVLVNEFMVEKFSAGATRLVNEALRREADYLIALAGSLDDAMPGATDRYRGSLIFNDPFSPSALRERAKLLDGLRGLPLPAIERAGSGSFTLGPARAALPPICKLVKRDTRKVSYGSYPRAAQTQYVAVCDPGDHGADACVAGTAYEAKEANCTPSIDFAE